MKVINTSYLEALLQALKRWSFSKTFVGFYKVSTKHTDFLLTVHDSNHEFRIKCFGFKCDCLRLRDTQKISFAYFLFLKEACKCKFNLRISEHYHIPHIARFNKGVFSTMECQTSWWYLSLIWNVQVVQKQEDTSSFPTFSGLPHIQNIFLVWYLPNLAALLLSLSIPINFSCSRSLGLKAAYW